MAVFEKVQDIIVDELGKEKEEVTLETSFEELDADSLDLSKSSMTSKTNSTLKLIQKQI